MELYQIWNKTFNDEQFCFFAENGAEAESKLRGWVNYHSHDRGWYSIKPVKEPVYKNNIHDEYVR